MKKRLLYVSNSLPYFLSHRGSLALAVQKQGFEIHLATPPENSEAIMTGSIIHHPIPLDCKGKNPSEDFKALLSIYKLYKQLSPSLIHHFSTKPMLYGSMLGHFFKEIPIVNAVTGLGYFFTDDSPKARLFSPFVKLGYRLSFRGIPRMKCIFENPDDRQVFLKEKIVNDGQAVLIRGAGVDPNLYPYSKAPSGTPMILFGARMIETKGIREFVDAARLLLREGVQARFVLAGDLDLKNPTAVSLEELQQWQKEGVIEWRGFVQDMPTLLQESAIVCLPSYREGLPRILLEAASCGRPLVTTNEPGCREIVIHDHNGYLVPSRNASVLADALRRLILDPQKRTEMGLHSRKMVEEQFSDDIVVSRTLEIYKQLLN